MLKIATYNIHKGYSQFNRRFVLHELRERLRELNADIVFLQEVQGAVRRARPRHFVEGAHPQHEFLAQEGWLHHAYGKNSVYGSGHHGNAILNHPSQRDEERSHLCPDCRLGRCFGDTDQSSITGDRTHGPHGVISTGATNSSATNSSATLSTTQAKSREEAAEVS